MLPNVFLAAIMARSSSGIPAGDLYMIASSRQHLPGGRQQATVAALQFNASAIEMISPPYQTTAPRFVWPGFYCQSSLAEAPLGNALPIEGASIVVNGVRTMLKFSGVQAGTVPDGGILINDEDSSIVIPPNTKIQVCTAWGVNLNDYYPTGSYVLQAGTLDSQAGGAATQVAKVTGGSAWTVQGYNTGAAYGPCLMVAKGWDAAGRPPVVLLVGDSIGYGANDNNGVLAPDGVFGYVGRGLRDSASSTRFPFANFCVPGHRFSQLSDTNSTDSLGTFAYRKQVLQAFNWPFTVILSEMGINTVANPQGADNAARAAWTIAQAQAAHAFLKTLGGRKVVQTTMSPQTTSQTDPGSATNYYLWTTNNPADQVRGSDNQHQALDDYLMGTPTNVDAVIDVRPTFQIDNGTGIRKWKAPGTSYTLQGAVTAGTNTLSLDVAPQIGDSLVIEPGSSANNEAVIVRDVTGAGPYTVTLKANLTKAHASGVTAAGAYSVDGTHTSQQGARLGSAAIIAAKNAGVFV